MLPLHLGLEPDLFILTCSVYSMLMLLDYLDCSFGLLLHLYTLTAVLQ